MPATTIMPAPSHARAALFLFGLTFRRQFFSRQTLVNVVLTTLCALIILAWTMQPGRSIRGLSEFLLWPTYGMFLMPIFAISYAASSIGGEREDQSLIYLLVTPLPRGLVYLMKSLATGLLVSGWSLGALGLLCWIAGDPGAKLWVVYAPACLLGSLGYAAVFQLLGAMFRYGTILALAYWFFLEVLFGAIPGTMKRITVAFYIRCMLNDAGQEYALGPQSQVQRDLFLGIEGTYAMLALLTIAVGLTIAGAALFSTREYAELG